MGRASAINENEKKNVEPTIIYFSLHFWRRNKVSEFHVKCNALNVVCAMHVQRTSCTFESLKKVLMVSFCMRKFNKCANKSCKELFGAFSVTIGSHRSASASPPTLHVRPNDFCKVAKQVRRNKRGRERKGLRRCQYGIGRRYSNRHF